MFRVVLLSLSLVRSVVASTKMVKLVALVSCSQLLQNGYLSWAAILNFMLMYLDRVRDDRSPQNPPQEEAHLHNNCLREDWQSW